MDADFFLIEWDVLGTGNWGLLVGNRVNLEDVIRVFVYSLGVIGGAAAVFRYDPAGAVSTRQSVFLVAQC